MPLNEEADKADAQSAAREYAWNWFAYHAGQRQAVFRFYLVLSGATLTAYFGMANIEDVGLKSMAFWFGGILAIISFLFWRLDVRSIALIKHSEAFLKVEEERLCEILNTPEIRLANLADEKRVRTGILRWFISFRQIYRAVFVMIGCLGLILFLFGTGALFPRLISMPHTNMSAKARPVCLMDNERLHAVRGELERIV